MLSCQAKNIDPSYYNRNIFFNADDQSEIVRILELRLIELFQPNLYTLKERVYHIEIALKLVNKYRKQSGEMCGAEWIYRHYTDEFESLKKELTLAKKHILHRKTHRTHIDVVEPEKLGAINSSSIKFLEYAKKTLADLDIPHLYKPPIKTTDGLIEPGNLTFCIAHPDISKFQEQLGWY